MRPLGEVSFAILHAAESMATEVAGQRRGATVQELAARARVGSGVALVTVKNLTRAGRLDTVYDRKVDYRNRPVKEYAPRRHQVETPPDEVVDMSSVFALWATQG